MQNCAEALLDVEYIMSVAQLSATTFWSVSPTSSFADWITAVAATATPPLVHSISYGSYEENTPDANIQRFNDELVKLCARGVTVVVSSGDDGVANFQARQNRAMCGFHPSWPASSPYVVSVGATMGPEFGTAEVTCQSDQGGVITSGGGFATKMPQPSYQSAAVAAFLKQSTVPTSLFNSKGRGYPDVSIIGHNYDVFIGKQAYQLSGTSASAPVFAAMLTLINDGRAAAGKAPVGFVNPALYQLAAQDNTLFRDITVGNNACTANANICCQYGFAALPGWDAATGIGGVLFDKLLPAFIKL